MASFMRLRQQAPEPRRPAMKRMAAVLAALGVFVVAVTAQAVSERTAMPPDPCFPLVDVVPFAQ
jgi:hypothetical protein